jgi:2-polyprenyl-3-methyl-5-hydroxy-6-metoxy-1,4-benzoquinol methylase
MDYKNYFEINKSLWNGKTAIHVKSDFYDVESFKKGKSSLNFVELDALGDVKGKSILHLQCHFGQDSLSWVRLGAMVTGVDLSDSAIEYAKSLNKELGLDAEFICSNVYDLKEKLDKKFDIVFTSYGITCWLPDLDGWAEIISHFLKPGGIFFMAEFHPVVCMFINNYSEIKYSYFNSGVEHETNTGTYADLNADFTHECYEWSHSLSEVFNALIKNSLNITEFKEFPFSFYNVFNMLEQQSDGNWHIKDMNDKIPVMFSIKAVKK